MGAGPAAEQLVAGLDAAPGDAVDARLVATEDEAVGLLKDREMAGALLPPAEAGGTATIYTANAAGASQASTVQQVLAPLAVENEWRTAVEDVAPLADGDMSGTAVLFAGMGMMLAGYVPLSLMTMSLPYLLRLRRFLRSRSSGRPSPAPSSGRSWARWSAPSTGTTWSSSASACWPPAPSP
ncbi:hypothetical protein ACFQVA_05120 [Actinomadura keratinilytica]